MALGEILFSRMTTEPTVSGLIGQRCYPLTLPQETPLPAVSYQAEGWGDSQGSGALEQNRVRVAGWATSYAGAIGLATALVTALDGYQAKSATPALIHMALENRQEIFEPETGLYGVVLDFSAWVVE